MNKFKIIFKIFLYISIVLLTFTIIILILAFLLVHVYIFFKIFYNARPGFEFQGRIIK
jgi:hypothetical protein